MSFQYVPSQFRIPEVPNWTPPNGFWCGLNADAGYFAFNAGYSWGGYVMTRDYLCYSLKIDSSELHPVYSSINGYIYWEGNGYVYYTQTYGWVWSSLFPGYEPLEETEYDEEKKEWVHTGDAFYTIGSIPYSEDSEQEMTGRGTNYGKEGKKLKCVWKRWASNSEFGKYEPKGDASGDKYLGLPRFTGNGAYYVRSFAKEKGYYKYGEIHHADGKWVIGEIGSDSGWWEGSEPSKEGSVTFKFTVNEGSEAKGQNISVSLKDYVKGDERVAVMLGEAAIWR